MKHKITMDLEKFIFHSAEDIKKEFNWRFEATYQTHADKNNLPSDLEIFIPYIDYFYVPNQYERELIMKKAPLESLKLLKEIIDFFENKLDDFLGGVESYLQESSMEYIALTELRSMAELYDLYR